MTLPQDQAGGRPDSRRTERASATPTARGPLRAQRGATTLPPGLKAQLTWFQAAVTAPRPPPATGALHRPELLEVYRYAYRARLEEALDDDFEAVRVFAGSRWPSLVAAYLRDCPSASATLNDYGARFPAWLRQRRQVFLADLAALEWALVEVLHAPAAPALDLPALAKIPLEAWAEARFTPAGTLRLVTSPWPINDLLDAVRQGEVPPRPGRRATAVVAYRRGFDLWRQALTPTAHRVLAALLAGQPLGQALEPIPDTQAPDILACFQEWVGKGFFAGVQVGA